MQAYDVKLTYKVNI